MTTIPQARPLADQVDALLNTIEHLTVFRGRAGEPPMGDDDTVDAYVTAHYGAGTPHVRRLGGRARNLAWSFQLTCVGGDDRKCLWAVDQVRAKFQGARLEATGRTTGLLREIGDAGPIREDRSVSPYRYYLPLDFGLYI